MHKILVINPNSNDLVTKQLQASFCDDRFRKDTQVECVTLEEGPFGIETDEDISFVGPLVTKKIDDEILNYDAFVIACYSDPGLTEARRNFSKAIYGIHEAAVKFCAHLELKFGVIALGEDSIKRHADYIKQLNLGLFYIGEEALDISVNEAVCNEDALEKIVEAGNKLIEAKESELIILGCAGMARHRFSAEKALGIRVIDPVHAGVDLAIANFT